jgi:hypothetical protein
MDFRVGGVRAKCLGWMATLAASLGAAGAAQAYEYPLLYTPVGNYKDLVIAGYQITLNRTIIGNCSYVAIRSGSGRDPRQTYIPMPQTCTWDRFGHLLSTVAGAPIVPSPLSTQGTETIYAQKSKHFYTGADSALTERGFVFFYGEHYEWLTSNAYMVLPYQPYTFTVSLTSNGDEPLTLSKITAKTSMTLTSVTVDSTTCLSGPIAVGATCDITVTYDFHKLSSPSGLAYDGVTIHLGPAAGEGGFTTDFAQRYTLEVPVPVDTGGG